jgi:WD40 repeat protein
MEELENELEVSKINMPDFVTALAWAADDVTVLAGDAQGNLSLITPQTGNVELVQHHADSIMTLTCSNEENVVFSSAQDGSWKLCKIPSLEIIAEGNVKGWIEHAHWSPDGKQIAFSFGKTVEVRDLKGNLSTSFTVHESTVSGISWRYDNKAIAVSCYGSLNLYDLFQKSSKKLIWKTSLISLEWSPDGKFIVAGTQDCTVHIWIAPFRENNDSEMSGYPSKVKHISFDSKSKYLATNCHNDLVLWKFAGKAPLGQKPMELKGHAAPVKQLAFQSDGKMLVSGDALGFLLFWIPDIRKELITGARIKGEISALKWSNDNLHIAAATAEGEVVVMESPE